jgi:hypothetical protein
MSTTANSREKSVQLPKFYADTKFQMWWTQFLAYAGVMKFTAALKDLGEPTMPADEDTVNNETTAPGRASARANESNVHAVACLITALTTEDDMALVFESTCDEWSAGLAWEIVNSLKEKYQPDDVITGIERERDLRKVKMKANDKLSTLFEQLSAINNKYNKRLAKMTVAQQVQVIVKKAPRGYQSLLVSKQLQWVSYTEPRLKPMQQQQQQQQKKKKRKVKRRVKYYWQWLILTII